MWSRINQEVLCNIDISTLDIKVDLSPRQIDNSIGSGVFSHGWSIIIDSPDSIKLQKALAHIEDTFLTNPIDIGRAEAWLKSIHMVWQELFCLIHVLSGPFPLFFKEELELLYSTHPTRRGDFFLVDGYLAIINSYEGERHSMLGEYKKKLRLLPHSLSTALMIMLRLIRPLELSMVQSTPDAPRNKQKLLQDYRHILYVSHGLQWSLEMLSNIWADWITKGMGFYLEPGEYRTFCKTWKTKYVTTSKVGWLEGMADAQAGHSKNVSQKHYAVLNGLGGLSTEEALLHTEQCLTWHKFLGF